MSAVNVIAETQLQQTHCCWLRLRINRCVPFLLNQVCPDPDAGFVAAIARTGAADAALRTLELLGDTAERQPFAEPAADSGVGTLCFDAASARITE